MENSEILRCLQPFLAVAGSQAKGLDQSQLNNISKYLDLLLRWNARMNLTAVREPENIVTRHFGESLFTAHHLFPAVTGTDETRLIDVGSGAGFPGIPIKLWNPGLKVTLIESNHKKATFLREVIRSQTLDRIEVYVGRAENYSGGPADVVTLRAVERFGDVLPTVRNLVAPEGRLALLIGTAQSEKLPVLTPDFSWSNSIRIPLSTNRILLIGQKQRESS